MLAIAISLNTQTLQAAWRFIRQPAHPRANLAKMPAFSTYAAGTAVSKEPDRLFAQPLAQVPDFAFNEDVVRVFPDMIKR